MASANSNAGSFTDNTEGNTPAAKDCPLHPGPNGACEACMEDLKMELATTRDLLTRATVNEERTNKDLLIASQKLSRFMKDAKKTRTELDDMLAKIISGAVDTQSEVNARLDDLTNEVTQKLADIKVCLTEKLVAYAPEPSTSQQEGAASTSKAAGPPTGPRMCVHHETLGKNSNKCSDEHCSMRGKLAPPKRPHPEQNRSDRPTKRVDVEPRPPPVPPHSVIRQEGDESWTVDTQPDGGTGDGEDEDIIIESIVYLGKGHAPTK